MLSLITCDVHLVPFVEFKKREKYPWNSVSFSKLQAKALKVTLLHGCFHVFKLYK